MPGAQLTGAPGAPPPAEARKCTVLGPPRDVTASSPGSVEQRLPRGHGGHGGPEPAGSQLAPEAAPAGGVRRGLVGRQLTGASDSGRKGSPGQHRREALLVGGLSEWKERRTGPAPAKGDSITVRALVRPGTDPCRRLVKWKNKEQVAFLPVGFDWRAAARYILSHFCHFAVELQKNVTSICMLPCFTKRLGRS